MDQFAAVLDSEIILGAFLEVFLDLNPTLHYGSFWAPWVAILAFSWRLGKIIFKKNAVGNRQRSQESPGPASCGPLKTT